MSVPRLVRRTALVVAVTSSVLVAAPAQARGAHCGMKIEHDFTLHRDLRHCRGDGLVVVADNVTVDLKGHTIAGSGKRTSAGVRVKGVDGVTVERGRIRHFGMGILLTDSSHTRISGNRIRRSFDEGVYTDETSSHLMITGNRIVGSGMHSRSPWADGIDARGDAVRVLHNVVFRNHDDGIDVNGADLTVAHNRVVRNVHDGIDIDGREALILDNLSKANGDDGIGVSRLAQDVTIRGNTLVGNADLGVQPVAGTFVDGGGNRASSNGDTRQCVRVACSG